MAAFKYEYAGNIGKYKVSAQVVGEICEQLEREGGLTPKALLDKSRDESSPLHSEFEWDDTIAAEKYRIEQARLMIANIRIVPTTDVDERKEPVRAFVSTPGGTSVYASLSNALKNDEWKKHLLEQACKDSEVYLAKYRRLEELSAVTDAMMDFLNTVG